MKQFILVAGIDYERKGVDFSIFCRNRVRRVVSANRAKDDLAFHVFDVKAGTVSKHEVTYVSGKKTEKVNKTSPFTPIKNSHYDKKGSASDVHFVFKNGQTGMMSITDVYDAVRAIGSADPGTLFELSFFSHAWHGGPILVNSFDDGFVEVPVPFGAPPRRTALGASRDPDDKDPRAAKDFSPPNMSAAALKTFQDAYHTDGYNWSWGCAFPRTIHEILHKLERHANYKSTGLADADTFLFTNFRADHITSLEGRLGVTFPDKKRVQLTFKDLKHYFCTVTEDSYTHQLAVKSKKKTFGGVMGTYSEYDSGPLPLMHVHKGFTRHFTFYKNYLGFSFDPEKRNYGEFKPTFTCP